MCFFGFVLSSLGFSPTSFLFFSVLLFFQERDRSGSNRTPHTHWFGLFFFSFCPAAFGFSPFLAVRPASWPFLGAPFSAPRVFGILLVLVLRPPFGREAAWVFRCFLCWFLFFPFCFAGTRFLEGPGVVSLTRRVVSPTPRRSDSGGKAHSWAGVLDAPFSGIDSALFCLPEGHRDPRTHCVRDLFGKEGAHLAPSSPTFHTHACFPCPRFFFVFFGGPLRPASTWIARRNVCMRTE